MRGRRVHAWRWWRGPPSAGAGFVLLQLLLALVGLLLGHGNDLRSVRDGLVVVDHVVEERLDLRPLERLRARIHEQRPGQRLVLTALDRLGGGLDALPPALADTDQVQLVLVLLVVREAEVAEPAVRAGDALDEDVVVRRGLVVLPRDALLTVDLLGEEVERARVRVRAEQLELRVWEARADLAQALDLRALVPDLPQLRGGQAVNRHVFVGHDCDPVVRHLDLVVVDALLLADRGFFVGLDRARGVRDVGLSGAELLETAAGAGGADRDLHAGVLALELFLSGLGERGDGARPVDLDRPGEVAASPAAPSAAVVVVVPAGRRAERQRAAHGEREELPHLDPLLRFRHVGVDAVTGALGSLLWTCRPFVKMV